MDTNNTVVLRGVITSDPKVRDLPSGSRITNLEVTTRSDALTASVPVVVHDADAGVSAGDEVVVVGHVHRRFFRAGGVTQSRTEVVASRVVLARRRRTASNAVAAAVALLSPDRGDFAR